MTSRYYSFIILVRHFCRDDDSHTRPKFQGSSEPTKTRHVQKQKQADWRRRLQRLGSLELIQVYYDKPNAYISSTYDKHGCMRNFCEHTMHAFNISTIFQIIDVYQ